ncbi:hypothetical protein CONPUDRAFT_40087, partial [Coniophora puteana RWD-64-598 SS2]
QYIVHSPTYQVPVFYFSIQDTKGSPLTLDDIIETSILPTSALEGTERNGFAITYPGSSFPLLSQGEHPTTGLPCWYVHPCESEAATDELWRASGVGSESESEERVRWMEAWFVVLGHVVSL